MDYLTCSSCKRSKPAADFGDTGCQNLKICSACRAKGSRWRVRATVQDESHSSRVRPPFGELSPNLCFNRLEEETEQDKRTRRIAEAKDKNARARQRARKRGDILTATPPERVKQFEQPEQLCSRCHCPRSPNQFQSSQQEALPQQLLHLRNVEEQIVAFVIIRYKHVFRMIPNLFGPHSIASLHLLAARRLFGPHSIASLHLLSARQLFGIIPNLFGPHSIASLHLLAARRPLRLHRLCMTLLSQKNTGDILAISIKSWLNDYPHHGP